MTRAVSVSAARRAWPHAAWIIGDGPFASVAHCGVVTVILFRTLAEACRAKVMIDQGACGHACHGAHEVVGLDDESARLVRLEDAAS